MGSRESEKMILNFGNLQPRPSTVCAADARLMSPRGGAPACTGDLEASRWTQAPQAQHTLDTGDRNGSNLMPQGKGSGLSQVQVLQAGESRHRHEKRGGEQDYLGVPVGLCYVHWGQDSSQDQIGGSTSPGRLDWRVGQQSGSWSGRPQAQHTQNP